MTQENKNETIVVPASEVVEVQKKEEKRRHRAMAIMALAGSLFGFGTAEAAPHVADAIHTVAAPVANALHQTTEADLTGSIRETVPLKGTIEQLAVEADPSVDPRIIESALIDRGITTNNLHPGEIVDVPVTQQAEASHEAAQH